MKVTQSMSNPSKDWPPKLNWLADGNETPIAEGYLVGDRRGLESLQHAIQSALDSKEGSADIRHLRSPWSHVHVREAHPEAEQKRWDATPRALIVKIVGLGIIGGLVFLAIFGCMQLPTLFK
jgi:hypothetical protein